MVLWAAGLTHLYIWILLQTPATADVHAEVSVSWDRNGAETSRSQSHAAAGPSGEQEEEFEDAGSENYEDALSDGAFWEDEYQQQHNGGPALDGKLL